MNRHVIGKPQCLANPRNELELLAKHAAAEFAGDQDRVARSRTAAPPAVLGRHLPQRGDADHQRPAPTVRIAAHDRAIELAASGSIPSYKRLASVSPPVWGKARETRPATGCAAMAAKSLKLTASDLRPIRWLGLLQHKIDSIHQHVARDDQVRVVVPAQDRRIIPWSDAHSRMRRETVA